MNKHHQELRDPLSRRQVMIGAAGLSFAIALGGRADAAVLRGRTHRPGAEPVGQHRDRRHHHHHVGGDRDGAGVDDLAAADHRRRARRRLAQGAHRAGAGERQNLRQSGLWRHDVHRRLQRGDELLPAAADDRRAGAPRAARQCRAQVGRAGRGADHRAERGGAREIRTQAELRRHRRLRRSAGQGAGDQAGAAQEAGRLPPDRQGRDAGRIAEQGQRQRAIRHRHPGAGNAVRHGAARPGRRIGPGQDRRCQGEGGARRHRGHQAAARRRRRRRDRVGGVLRRARR